MAIVVDQSQLARVLTILRDSADYREIKQDLDEYLADPGWVDVADDGGSFALAFTRNSETEGGWLPQAELETFWRAVADADPTRASAADELHRLLLGLTAAWRTAAPSATDDGGDGSAGLENVTDMAGATYVGWQQGYDRTAGVWKYRGPDGGPWLAGEVAFPPVAPGSRIFRVGALSFLSEGNGERQVWPHPSVADAYYDAANTYDLMGNVATAAREQPADVEREMRELFDIPPDTPMWTNVS